MKKLYSLIVLCLCAVLTASAAKGTLNIGYPINYDYVYSYDGFGGLTKDTKIGAAIAVPRSMVEAYLGAEIKGVRIGWADPQNSASATVFVRKTLNGENLISKKATLTDKQNGAWNTVNFDTPMLLEDDYDLLYVGYECTLKAGSFGVSTMYPHGQAGAAYLWRNGVNDKDGTPLWEDMSQDGTLAIQIVIQGETSQFSNMGAVSQLRCYPVGTVGKQGDGLLTIRNMGMNAISSVTLTYTNGEVTKDYNLSLSSTIAKGASSTVSAPIINCGTGAHQLTLSKINGKENSKATPLSFNQLGVPADVAKQYTRRSLVEYIECENAYKCVEYQDDFVIPGLANFKDKTSIIATHFNDQYMMGEEEELSMLLDLDNNDSTIIFVPTLMIDRSQQVANIYDGICARAPWSGGVTLPDYIAPIYRSMTAVSTFAGLNLKASFNKELDGGTVTVDGDIASGILPEGEDLGLVVFLVEDNVESDSQLLDSDDKKAPAKKIAPAARLDRLAYEDDPVTDRTVIHHNICRCRLTPLYGDNVGHGGTFSKTYEFFIEDEWKPADMRFVAFLCRDAKANAMWDGNVINCAEAAFTDYLEGVRNITTNPILPSETLYDLQGRAVKSTSFKGGLLIQNGQKVLR